MTQPTEPADADTFRVELLEGYQYAFCTCGLSSWFPFCDGAHTMKPPSQPRVFIQAKDQTLTLHRPKTAVGWDAKKPSEEQAK